MKVLLLGDILKLLLVLMVMMMGRWSEVRVVLVLQEVRLLRFAEMEVMSGEVGCCVECGGSRVGVFWFRMV